MAEVKNYWGVRADIEIRQSKQQKQELWDGMHRFDAAMKYIAEGMSDEEVIKKIGIYKKVQMGKERPDYETLETYKKVARGDYSEGHDDLTWRELMGSVART